MKKNVENIGAVAIGRNEGDRLITCLKSLQHLAPRLVYVDSGSTDQSISAAQSLGAEVVHLDTSSGFTAARARNAGWQRLLEKHPDLEWIQFVDGDCEVLPEWLAAAQEALQNDPQLAVVCGRRRERYPDRSIYNRLCDLEWNTPVGDAKACGGDAMFRAAALRAVGGYHNGLIAGEEPELCVRLRAAGWKIRRLGHDMTWHDAAMTRFGQWFKRAQRAGHAYAEGFALHGKPPENHYRREVQRIAFWSFVFPLVLTLLAPWTHGWSLLGLLFYPVQALKIARSRQRSHHDPLGHCLLFGISCVASKCPEAVGSWIYLTNRLRGRHASIMEYK